MKKSVFKFILLLSVIILFGECSILSRLLKLESPKKDEIPPPNYDPNYLETIIQIPSTPPLQNKPEIDIFKIDASNPNLIKIYVHLVDSNGNYLRGATASNWIDYWCEIIDEFKNESFLIPNFEIKEEEISAPHAISLVLDHSDSIGKDRAFVIQNAVEQFIKSKAPDDAIAIIKFDNKVGIEASITSDSNQLLSSLKKNGLDGYGRSTAILDGIDAGIRQLNSLENYERKTIVLITDGRENDSRIDSAKVIALAQNSKVSINAVGFGFGINESFLKEIAKACNGAYRRIYRTDEFLYIFRDTYLRIKNHYLIEYMPFNFGIHNITIKFCLPNDTLIAKGTYDNTLDEGDIVWLNVHFDFDSTNIKEEYIPAINNVYEQMKKNPNLKIEIQAHTDSLNSTGDPDYNFKLSQGRADAVRKVLSNWGIEADRIHSMGYGASYPVADNRTENGRSKNRRAEFKIISK